MTFARVFGHALTLAKYCQQEWPSEYIDHVVASMVRNRRLQLTSLLLETNV
jgi:hypothetical protein